MHQWTSFLPQIVKFFIFTCYLVVEYVHKRPMSSKWWPLACFWWYIHTKIHTHTDTGLWKYNTGPHRYRLTQIQDHKGIVQGHTNYVLNAHKDTVHCTGLEGYSTIPFRHRLNRYRLTKKQFRFTKIQ